MHVIYSHTENTYIHKNESKHSEMGPVRQNPIQRTVRSVHVCALHCTQLLHTILYRTDLIIYPLTLQTTTTALIMSIWGKRGGLRSQWEDQQRIMPVGEIPGLWPGLSRWTSLHCSDTVGWTTEEMRVKYNISKHPPYTAQKCPLLQLHSIFSQLLYLYRITLVLSWLLNRWNMTSSDQIPYSPFYE